MNAFHVRRNAIASLVLSLYLFSSSMNSIRSYNLNRMNIYTSNQKVAPLYQKKCITAWLRSGRLLFFKNVIIQAKFPSSYYSSQEGKEGHMEQKKTVMYFF